MATLQQYHGREDYTLVKTKVHIAVGEKYFLEGVANKTCPTD